MVLIFISQMANVVEHIFVLVGKFFTPTTTREALDNFKLFHQFQGYLMCFYFSQLAKKSPIVDSVLYHLP